MTYICNSELDCTDLTPDSAHHMTLSWVKLAKSQTPNHAGWAALGDGSETKTQLFENGFHRETMKENEIFND